MIAFNKYYNKFNILSISLVLVSLILLTFKGLNFGIDFKGGTLIELRSNHTKINVKSSRKKRGFRRRRKKGFEKGSVRYNTTFFTVFGIYCF